VLVLVALAAAAADQPCGPRQDRTRYELTRHLVLQHTLVLEPGLFDRAVFGGNTYSDKAPGMSFLAVPAYELERVAGIAKAPVDWHAKGDASLWLIRVLTSGVLFLVSVFVVGRLAERLVAGTGLQQPQRSSGSQRSRAPCADVVRTRCGGRVRDRRFCTRLARTAILDDRSRRPCRRHGRPLPVRGPG